MSRALLVGCVVAAVLGMSVRSFPTLRDVVEPARLRHLLDVR